MKALTTLLVANRGEIAVRVMRGQGYGPENGGCLLRGGCQCTARKGS